MTHEESNGTASDDQRCYIERLERIETAARMLTVFVSKVYGAGAIKAFDALKAALEANR